jgi:hypothetical protein
MAAQLPLGDLVCARALRHMSPEAAGPIVEELMTRQPLRVAARVGQRVLVGFPGGTQADFEFDEEAVHDSAGVANLWPALVMSHCAGSLATGHDAPDASLEINSEIWRTFGAFGGPLIRLDVDHITRVHEHEAPDGQGSYVCARDGIVEPITWSLVKAFHKKVFDMKGLATAAMQREQGFLVARLLSAARAAARATEEDVARAGQEVEGLLTPWFHTFLGGLSDPHGRT